MDSRQALEIDMALEQYRDAMQAIEIAATIALFTMREHGDCLPANRLLSGLPACDTRNNLIRMLLANGPCKINPMTCCEDAHYPLAYKKL